MKFYVDGIGVRGPGLPNWTTARAVLAGCAPYQPAEVTLTTSDTLPPAERRRATDTVKLAIAVCSEAMHHAGACSATTPSVFASSGGDGATITAILENLATPARELSPTRFHNSVHNAPAGYWSIATQSRAASTTVCGYDASFAVGLLEATSQALVSNCSVLLAAYDLPYPPALHAVRPIAHGFGLGLVLSPYANVHSVAECRMELTRDRRPATALADPMLEALRVGNPAARALSLLLVLAERSSQTVLIDYVSGQLLAVTLQPIAAPAP